MKKQEEYITNKIVPKRTVPNGRTNAMELRAKIEIPKLKKNDVIRVRIIAVGIKHIIVDMYGKEIIIKADNLKHTYIVNCKDIYKVGDYLQVRIKNIDIENNIFELSAKDFEDNPFKNIRKYIKQDLHLQKMISTTIYDPHGIN